MKKIVVLIVCFLSFLSGFSKTGEDIGRGAWKTSTATVTKTIPNKTYLNDVVLNINFKCPGDACSKKGIKLTVNDQIIPAKLDKKNNFIHVIKPGHFQLEFTAAGYFSATTDSITFQKGTKVFIEVQFEVEQKNMITRKPVIYLYPDETIPVNVQLAYNGDLEFTYPQYNDQGWNITAYPDGTMEENGKKYTYLFWDGKMDQRKLNIDFSSGFVVESDKLTSFLESTLAQIGLNTKEAADFITFWVPLMQQNEKNYIHFLINENYNQVAGIKVTPEPDHILRVFMVWSKARGNLQDILPQTFPLFSREGFTVIEWGGSEYEFNAK